MLIYGLVIVGIMFLWVLFICFVSPFVFSWILFTLHFLEKFGIMCCFMDHDLCGHWDVAGRMFLDIVS